MSIALTGFLIGLSLIVAIGAQNAYLLRLGLSRNHVGTAVFICTISDAILIFAGVAGMGKIIESQKTILKIICWIGAIYLLYFAISALRRVMKSESLTPASEIGLSKKQAVVSVLGFTWLNPHVYLDTLLLAGSIGGRYGIHRWYFAIGSSLASLVWFTSLGYGAKALSKYMSRPITWKILDLFISVVMSIISISLIRTAIG
jgi:L-lysine exporter family protein LysE/ArgO